MLTAAATSSIRCSVWQLWKSCSSSNILNTRRWIQARIVDTYIHTPTCVVTVAWASFSSMVYVCDPPLELDSSKCCLAVACFFYLWSCTSSGLVVVYLECLPRSFLAIVIGCSSLWSLKPVTYSYDVENITSLSKIASKTENKHTYGTKERCASASVRLCR